MKRCSVLTRIMDPRVKPAGDGRILPAAENPMLASQTEPTVASVFAPRTKIESDGTVEGYASLFGEIDQAHDMVLRGAFAATLSRRGVHRVPMLFQHDPAEPVGVWLELREDHCGLYARGRLIPEVARARELLSLLKAGAIDGLSIGLRTVKGRIDPRTRVRSLQAVDLWEISIVTFPLLAGARVRAVKQAPSQLKASHARTRAERDWARVANTPAISTGAVRARGCSHPRTYRRFDDTLMCGRLRSWRQTG